MKKKILFFLCVLLSSHLLYAQINTDDWQLIKITDDVSSYYKKGICNENEVLIVKFVNNRDQAVKVSWSLWNGVTSRTIPIQAKQTKEGACNSSPAILLIDRIPPGLTVNDIHATINITLQ